MSIAKISSDKISQGLRLRKGERHFLLLNTSLFEDVLQELIAIDSMFTRRWFWEDTFLDEHKHRGPLLVMIEENSALLAWFVDEVAKLDKGILLISAEPMNTVLDHLHSFLEVAVSGQIVRFRIEDPRKLGGPLAALDSSGFSSLMGPIKRILFRENIADTHKWILGINHNFSSVIYSKTISWNEAETRHIHQYNLRLFLEKCTRILVTEYGFDEPTAEQATKKFAGKAVQLGFTEEKYAIEFVRLSVSYQSEMREQDVIAILENNFDQSKKLYKIKQLLKNRTVSESNYE